MSQDRDAWLNRLRLAEHEHVVVRLAATRFRDDAQRDSTLLPEELAFRVVRRALEHLEETYTVRIFSEFEAALRLYWRALKRKSPPSRTRDLLNGIASKRRIPQQHVADAHAIREYRNVLVHLNDAPVLVIPIAETRHRLARFLSYLPPKW